MLIYSLLINKDDFRDVDGFENLILFALW
jgi:hypothetical protein